MNKVTIIESAADPLKIVVNGFAVMSMKVGVEYDVSDEIVSLLENSHAKFTVKVQNENENELDEGDAKNPDESLSGQLSGTGTDLGILDGNTKSIKEAVSGLSLEALLELLAAESAGNTRKSVTEVLSNAIDTLKDGVK